MPLDLSYHARALYMLLKWKGEEFFNVQETDEARARLIVLRNTYELYATLAELELGGLVYVERERVYLLEA